MKTYKPTLLIILLTIVFYSFIFQKILVPEIALDDIGTLKEKDYYAKIFNKKDIKELKNAFKNYEKADKYYEKYDKIINKSYEFRSYSDMPIAEKDKLRYLNKADKLEKKAVKFGLKAMDIYYQSNNTIFNIYDRNFNKYSKNKQSKLNKRLISEIKADIKYFNNLSINTRQEATTLSDVERFEQYRYADQNKLQSIFCQEDLFFVYMNDKSEIKRLAEKYPYIKPEPIKKNYDINKDTNIYFSKVDTLTVLIKLNNKNKQKLVKIRSLNKQSLENQRKADSLYIIVSSLKEKAKKIKDNFIYNQYRDSINTNEALANSASLRAVKQNCQANERLCEIYGSNFQHNRPKDDSSTVYLQGEVFEKKAAQYFKEGSKIEDKAKRKNTTNKKHLQYSQANDLYLTAIQYQENAYSLYFGLDVKQQVFSNYKLKEKLIYASTWIYSDEIPEPILLKDKDGVFFRIDIGLSNTMLSVNEYSNLTPIVFDKYKNSSIKRFMLGEYETTKGASAALEKVKQKGHSKAKIVGFVNGECKSYAYAKSKMKKTPDDDNDKKEQQEISKIENGEVLEYHSTWTYSNSNRTAKKLKHKKGVIFKIDIGNSKKKLSANSYSNLCPITYHKYKNTTTKKYMLGEYRTSEAADLALKKAKQKGHKKAYIIGFVNGTQTTYAQAKVKIKKDEEYKNQKKKELAKINKKPKVQSTEPSLKYESTWTYSKINQTPTRYNSLSGVVFRIDVGYRNDMLQANKYKNLTPITYDKFKNSSKKRFMLGEYRTTEAADLALTKVKQKGHSKAFIVGFIDGKRITYEKAKAKIFRSEEYYNQKRIELGGINGEKIAGSDNNNNNTDVQVTNTGDYAKAKDITKTKYLIYVVRLGCFSTQKTSAELKNISNLYKNKTKNNLFCYFVGPYYRFQQAQDKVGEIKNLGFSDAFVEAYNNGTEINIAKAKKIEKNVNSNSNTSSNSNNNVVFKIQIGAYAISLSNNEINSKYGKIKQKYSINSQIVGSLNLYTVGSYSTLSEAKVIHADIKKMGYPKCFIIAFRGNEKISIKEALKNE